MNYVQSWNLIVSLAHHKEDCVEELGEFTEEIPPTTGSRSYAARCIWIIDWLTSIVEIYEPTCYTRFVEKKTAEENLQEVVGY